MLAPAASLAASVVAYQQSAADVCASNASLEVSSTRDAYKIISEQ